MKLTTGKLAAVGASAAMLALLAGPAFGSSGVNVTLNTSGPNGGRTLVLQNLQGTTLSSLDLSSGTNSFVAKVVDANYTEKGFTVQANMSNLYAFDGTNYTCADKVPSSAVTMSTPGNLEVAGIGVSLTPIFDLSGSLPAGSLTSSNDQLQGVAQSLSQTDLLGSTNGGSLYGTTLAGVLGDLPIQVSTPVGGPFTNPAADPPNAGCGVTGANATPVTIMSGTSNPTQLLTALTNYITAKTGSSAPPSVATLITDGLLDSNAVTSLLLNVTGLPLATLSPLLSGIESGLTATLDGVTPLLSSATNQSGTYSSEPGVAINTSGIPAGNYQGVMTVTLMDSSS